MKLIRQMFILIFGAITLLAAGGMPVQATTLSWAGYTWNVSPYGIGGGLVSGNPAESWIDSSGYLHLDMSNIGGTWYGAEVGTSNNFGFGSFYWVFSAPVTSLEKQDVLGGFTYGPQNGIGVDGENEIDVEFSKWNVTGNNYNGDFTIYPSTGHKKSNVNINWTYTGSTVCTCRVDWSSTVVTESIWSGVVPTNAPTSTAAVTWTDNGTTTSIPQAACPFLFNIWAYAALPTQAVDAVVQTFQYIPAGGIPPAPTGLGATPGNSQATLSWTASVGATSYNVYRGTTAGGEGSTPITTGATGTSFTNTALINGTTYYYKVAAVNSSGTSGMSNEASATPTSSAVNIAPTGTGYTWAGNRSATLDSNKVLQPAVNDNNLTTSVRTSSNGESGKVKWEAAGVTWPSLHTINSVVFINGTNDGGGNGYWQSGFGLEYTTNGSTWQAASGWTASPAYPNTNGAWGQSYMFSGPALTGVQGIRVVGKSGTSSYSGGVIELQTIGQ